MLATHDLPRVFQSSDLSRHAPLVFAAAEHQPVDVSRRDGEDMVLMSKREATSRAQLLELAATFIGVSTDDRGSLTERMSTALPWMLALDPQDRDVCAKDLLDAARASLATGQPHLALIELESWRETACALAAGLGSEPVEWLDVPMPVERP